MDKTAKGLVEYCKAQLGRPYWMGTFGNVATEYLYKSNKGRLPQYYTASDFPSQYGQRVHDCIGLVKGYIWSDTPESVPAYASNGCPDINEAGMLANSTEKGSIAALPELPGTLVYFAGHVGVYIGGGDVIEARGHAYGVVKTKLKDRPWTSWAKCPYITYEEETEVKEMIYNTIEDVPGYAKPTIQKLLDKDLLVGTDEGLKLNETMIRLLVINDRAGIYG